MFNIKPNYFVLIIILIIISNLLFSNENPDKKTVNDEVLTKKEKTENKETDKETDKENKTKKIKAEKLDFRGEIATMYKGLLVSYAHPYLKKPRQGLKDKYYLYSKDQVLLSIWKYEKTSKCRNFYFFKKIKDVIPSKKRDNKFSLDAILYNKKIYQNMKNSAKKISVNVFSASFLYRNECDFKETIRYSQTNDNLPIYDKEKNEDKNQKMNYSFIGSNNAKIVLPTFLKIYPKKANCVYPIIVLNQEIKTLYTYYYSYKTYINKIKFKNNSILEIEDINESTILDLKRLKRFKLYTMQYNYVYLFSIKELRKIQLHNILEIGEKKNVKDYRRPVKDQDSKNNDSYAICTFKIKALKTIKYKLINDLINDIENSNKPIKDASVNLRNIAKLTKNNIENSEIVFNATYSKSNFNCSNKEICNKLEDKNNSVDFYKYRLKRRSFYGLNQKYMYYYKANVLIGEKRKEVKFHNIESNYKNDQSNKNYIYIIGTKKTDSTIINGKGETK